MSERSEIDTVSAPRIDILTNFNLFLIPGVARKTC